MAPFLRYVARSALVTALGLLAACEHHEPDRSVTTASAASKTGASTAEREGTPPTPPACQVPLADPPPPKVGPASSCPADPSGPMQLPRAWVSFVEAPAAPRVAVEIAATDAARERGLMYRLKMPEDQGMIFDWTEPAPRSFWMRNTCISLDMLFIAADGTIAGILEQVPPLSESPRSVPCPVTHVLELNAGWSRAHGVAPGQRVRIES